MTSQASLASQISPKNSNLNAQEHAEEIIRDEVVLHLRQQLEEERKKHRDMK